MVPPTGSVFVFWNTTWLHPCVYYAEMLMRLVCSVIACWVVLLGCCCDLFG